MILLRHRLYLFMKKNPLFNLILAGVLILAAEMPVIAQDTTYLNAGWKETTADKATYFRIKMKTDSGWRVTDYYRSGKIQMKGLFLDDSLHMPQGETSWYNDKGGIIRSCSFLQGKAEEKETYYYDNGRKKATGTNKAGEKDGEWQGFYQSGKPSGKAIYEKGKQVSAVFFQEDGSVDKSKKIFMKQANYPGGPEQLLRYLNKAFKYPEIAVKKKIEGTVIVEFKVTKDGTITGIRVVESVDKSLDAEALRVIREMSDWEPAMIGGIPIDSYQKQPIVFHF